VVNAIAFHPRGPYVATAGTDPDGRAGAAAGAGTVQVWDTEKGTADSTTRFPVPLAGVTFSPDGFYLLAVARGTDGGDHAHANSVWVWNRFSDRSEDPGSEIELAGHDQSVTWAAFSPDGRFIVTTSLDGTARAWRFHDEEGVLAWESVALLQGHTKPVVRAAFSPDAGGRLLVTAGKDNTARVWDTNTWKNLTTLIGHTDALTDAQFSPDGNFVVTASLDGTARIWGATQGETIGELIGHRHPVNSATFSPDGASVVTAGGDGDTRVWKVGPEPEAELLGHTAEATVVAFSRDGQWVGSAGWDRHARVIQTGTWNPAYGPLLHEGPLNSLGFSRDSRLVVTASSEQVVRVWDARSGVLTGEYGRGPDPITFSGAAFSPDGRRLIANSSTEHRTRVFDVKSKRVLADVAGSAGRNNPWAVNRDGTLLVVVGASAGPPRPEPKGGARLWDARDGTMLRDLTGHEGAVTSAAFSNSGALVATSGEDHTARVWDARTGKLRFILAGHPRRVDRVVFSADDKLIATEGADGLGKIWDAGDGRELHTITGLTGSHPAIGFSPDGKKLVTESGNRAARVWDTGGGGLLHKLQGHRGGITAVSFDPSGGFVLTASRDGTAQVWDAEEGVSRSVLRGHSAAINTAVYKPGGDWVLTASADWTARLWDAMTGDTLLRFRGHQSVVYSAVFNPEGDFVATASHDGTARVWDAIPSGASDTPPDGRDKDRPVKPIAVMRGHTGPVTSVWFSPDGRRLLTASQDGTARCWAVAGREKGKEALFKLGGHDGPLTEARFSPDGTMIVTAWGELTSDPQGWENSARVVSLAPGGGGSDVATLPTPAESAKGHTAPVTFAAFSPDGSLVVTTSEDKTARVWGSNTWKHLMTLSGHGSTLTRAAFSTDGRRLVTTSKDNNARVWDHASGRMLAELKGHSGAVTGAEFEPTRGEFVLTYSRDDGTARVWELTAGFNLMTIYGGKTGPAPAFSPGESPAFNQNTGDVTDAAFSADGRYIVTASGDGVPRVYSCDVCGPLAELLKLAGQRTIRKISEPEKQAYLKIR
jgi:WD40 repeat protein